jgi:hypothetical protein
MMDELILPIVGLTGVHDIRIMVEV